MTETDAHKDPDGRIVRVLADGEPMALNADIGESMSFKRVDGEFADADPGEFPTFVMDMDGATPDCRYNPNHRDGEDSGHAPYTVEDLEPGEWYELTPPAGRQDLPTIRVEYPESDVDAPFADPGEFPRYEWELITEDPIAYVLYRRTKTTTKPVFGHTAGERAIAISEDPTHFQGEREVATERFLAGVKAMFVRGPSGYSREELQSLSDGDDLTWFHREFLESLRDRRDARSGRRPGEDADEPGMSPELWDLVEFARSEVTLSDWIGDDADREKKARSDRKQGDLAAFAGGGSGE